MTLNFGKCFLFQPFLLCGVEVVLPYLPFLLIWVVLERTDQQVEGGSLFILSLVGERELLRFHFSQLGEIYRPI